MAKSNTSKDKKKATSEKKKPSIKIFNLSRKPQQSNVVIEQHNPNKKWVNYDKGNLFPQRMVFLMDGSAVHSGLLHTKAKFIAGDGLSFEGEQAEVAEEFLEARIDTHQLLENTASDLALLNGFSWELIYNKGSEIDEINHKDITRIRSGELVEGVVEDYFFSSNWAMAQRKRIYNDADHFKPVEIKSYNFEKGRRDGKQLLYIKSYKQGKDFYPEPDYIGAINWVEVSGKISQFYSTNLDNGFSASTHIHVFGNFDPEEEAELVTKLNENYAGSGNAGEIVVTTGLTEEGQPIINSLPTFANANVLSELARKTNEEIAAAHRVPLSLTNIPFASGMQSESLAIEQATQVFQSTVIRPKQMQIERALNMILKDSGIEEATVKVKPLTAFNTNQSDTIKMATQTINEMREEAGKVPLEEGGEIIPNTPIEEEDGNDITDNNTAG